MKEEIKIPVISIVGKSGSGKTTLIEQLIPELKKKELRVATIKHHAHPGFEIDIPGKDTWRYSKAGSDLVIIAAPDKIATIKKTKSKLSLDEIIHEIKEIDIILTEGYLKAGKPAIEVVRSELGTNLICSLDQLIAIATDAPINYKIPQFGINDPASIANFLVNKFQVY
jgi:molybdopterin-guanine dinucleotide biosynthesis protein B